MLELEIDLDPAAALPTGSVTVNVFDQDIVGTVEPTGTARFAARALVRVVAGANGWGKTVARRDFHNDANVSTKTVMTATAAEIGETLAEAPDSQLGVDYVRTEGPASRVLAGFDWYVDFSGQTHVASYPAATPATDVEVLEYDPLTRTLTLGAVDSLVLPGMTFTDPNGRWDGTLTVRDVEQRFAGEGESTAIAFCGTASSSQGPRELLERFITETLGTPYLKTYRYRIVVQDADGRLELQAVKKTPGLPDVLPLSVWPGIPGASAKYSLDGAVVALAFLEGDPSRPIVVAHDPSYTALELHLNAQTLIELGADAPSFAARGDALEQIYQALLVFAGTSPLATIPQIAAAFAALLTALSAPAFTTPRAGVLVKVK